MLFMKVENQFLMLSEVGYFHKRNKGKGLKILTPKQMLQRLTIAIAQVKAGKSYK